MWHRELSRSIEDRHSRNTFDRRAAPLLKLRWNRLTSTENNTQPGTASYGEEATSRHVSLIAADVATRSRLNEFISSFGYTVSGCANIAEAARIWTRRAPAVCILDLDHALDPSALIREISSSASCPLITIASNAELSDRVLYLELGADDFIGKPVEPREVVARIRTLLRRSARDQAIGRPQSSKAMFGKCTFNFLSLELVSGSGRTETLTASEAGLLLMLLRYPNRVLTREQLQSTQPLSDDLALERSIDVRISRIRKKIECDARSPRFIKTVYGAGYIFACDVSWE